MAATDTAAVSSHEQHETSHLNTQWKFIPSRSMLRKGKFLFALLARESWREASAAYPDCDSSAHFSCCPREKHTFCPCTRARPCHTAGAKHAEPHVGLSYQTPDCFTQSRPSTLGGGQTQPPFVPLAFFAHARTLAMHLRKKGV